MAQAKNGNVYFKDAEHLIRSYREMASIFPAIKPQGYSRRQKAGPESARILTSMWSDQHYGTDLTAAEHLVAYSNREECRATAKILQNILDYKTDKRDSTTLHLDFGGDDFAGMLGHDDSFSAELQVQMARTSHIEAQIIAVAAANFPHVVVHRTWGNHGRDTLRHKGRADNFKWVNWEFATWLTVQALCRDQKNVRWVTDRKPVGFTNMFGWRKLRTHGDTVLGAKPGSPAFASQLNKISASPYYGGKHVDVACLGHWHSGQQFTEGHTEVFVNPALIPPDGFSQSHGFLTACGQFIFETTAKYAVGDSRKVRVGIEDYRNSALDGLITPWDIDMVFTEDDAA
jgi:hypothetical protein